MTALPPSSEYTTAINQGAGKTAFAAQRDFLAGLLSTDGLPATALATLGALLSAVVDKSAAYTLVTTDRGKLINATTGTWSLSLPAAATAGAGFSFALRNSGTGTITIDPSGSELVDGAATAALAAGRAALVICTGTAWLTMALASTAAGASLAVSGTAAAPGQSFASDPDSGFFPAAANVLGLALGGSEKGRFHAYGLRLGSTTQVSSIVGGLETFGVNQNAAGIAGVRFSADTIGPVLYLGKSRGATVGDFSAVAADDRLGVMEFRGSDGAGLFGSAVIDCYVDGAVSTGNVPGRIRFVTTPVGGVAAERMRISSGGIVSVAGGMLTLQGNQLGGYQVTIADDAVASWTLPKAGGFANVTCGGHLTNTAPLEAFSARLWFDAGSSLNILKDSGIVGVGASVNVVTTALTGTSGTDGYVTIGVQAGVMQVENRSGASRVFQINVN